MSQLPQRSTRNPAPLITVLTPTKNSCPCISSLVKALEDQSCSDFSWLVVDGGSQDGTIGIVEGANVANKDIIRTKDFSIYHALNIGLDSILTPYYLVIGSDDIPSPDCISNYIRQLNQDPLIDIVFQGVYIDTKYVEARTSLGWLYGMHGLGSSHSLGTLIRTSLHKTYGDYSREFPRLADQYFIKKAVYGGSRTTRLSSCAGSYSSSGFSAANKHAYLLELYLLQLQTEKLLLLQHLLFGARWLKHFAFAASTLK
jgi:glycosyltransferase involved in cell wall biosynthesis